MDPSHCDAAQSIPVVYFFNDPHQYVKDVKIGDIIIIRNFRFQLYQNFPQLSGSDKGSLFFFRSRWNIIEKGLYSMSLDPSDLLFLENEAVPDEERMTDEVATTSFQSLNPADWSAYVLGRAAKNFKLNSMDFHSSLAIQSMFAWNQHYFSTNRTCIHTLQNVANLYIHDIFRILHTNANTLAQYTTLSPEGISNPSRSTDQTSSSGFRSQQVLKCDMIGLVIKVIEGTDTTPASLLVWDGTSSGLVQQTSEDGDESSFGTTIQRGLLYPQVFHQLLQTSPSASTSQSNPQTSVVPAAGTLSQFTTGTEKYSLERFNEVVTQLESAFSTEHPQFFGQPLTVQGFDISQNNFIARFKVGTWIRIQNLYLNPSPAPVGGSSSSDTTNYAIRAIIRPDTHIGELEPSYA